MSKTVQNHSIQSPNSYQSNHHQSQTISGGGGVTTTNHDHLLMSTSHHNHHHHPELLLQQPDDLFQQLESELQQGLEVAVKHHKILMGELVENCFLTEKQIQHQHQFYLKLIKEAFSFSLSSILVLQNNYPQVVQEKLTSLTTTINSQLSSYIRKHEIVTDSLSAKIKDFTNQADCLYEDFMEEILEKIRNNDDDGGGGDGGKVKNFDLTNLHNQCRQKSLTEFRRLLHEIGVKEPDFWQIELEFKIHEKFQDYQLEFCTGEEEVVGENHFMTSSEPQNHHTNHVPVLKEEDVKNFKSPPQPQSFSKIHQHFATEKVSNLNHMAQNESKKIIQVKSTNFNSVDEAVTSAFATGRRTSNSAAAGQHQIPPTTNQIKRGSVHYPSLDVPRKLEDQKSNHHAHVTPKNASDHWRIALAQNFTSPSSRAGSNPVDNKILSIFEQKNSPVPAAAAPLNLVAKTTGPPPPLLQPLNSKQPANGDPQKMLPEKSFAPAISPGPAAAASASHIINLGMHLEGDSIWVGVFRNSGEFQPLIQSMVASIVFLESGKILIGPEATSKYATQSTYFTLPTLLTAPPTKARELFCSRDPKNRQSIHLCNEEVMAAFFLEIKRLVQTRLSTVLFNVVISLSFMATSDQRERLRAAACLAGFRKSRIFSSFLSTAISLSLDYQQTQNNPPKYFCIAHSDTVSFSAAIVEVHHSSAVLRAAYGTETIKDRPGQDFFKGQERLVNNQSHGHGHGRLEEGAVQETYEKILKMCRQRAKNLPVEEMLFVNGNGVGAGAEKILLRLCGNKLQKLDTTHGPLKGASFLASILGSKTHPFQALDMSQCDLELTIGDTQPHCYPEFQQILSKRKVFSRNIYVTKGGSCSLKLEQKFWNKNSAPVSDYQLTLKLPPQIQIKKEECIVTVEGHVDEDGIYQLTFHPGRADVTVNPLRRDRYLLALNWETNFSKFRHMFQNMDTR